MSSNVVGQEYSKTMQGKKKKATFECQSCTRKFATRSHLVRHSRVHTGERRYACDYPGCEMRCSRKDNLQQHYRTHLVVNPRRANAQSVLATGSHDFEPESATTDMAHDFSSDKMTSPTDLKPIITSNVQIPSDPSQSQPLSESHGIAINGNGNPVNVHPALGGPLHGDDSPERDWSISPPPPLSSAYDYWYAHGCLPQAARNPASVSGSGSSGATSPEISNALELAPGQIPRAYVDSPTTYYHHPPPPLGSAVNNGYSNYDGEGAHGHGAAQRAGFPLATATFPTAAEYQHPAASHSHPQHQRSHSHSYSIGGSSSVGGGGGGGGYAHTRLGYQSASTSPHLSSVHLHHGQPGIHTQGQARHHSYSTDSYDASTATTASYANNPNPRSLAVGYHGHSHSHSQGQGPSASNSPTDRFSQTSTNFHAQQQPHPGHGHSHSHSGSSHTFQPMSASRIPAREPGQDSRPVTRHGSTGYSMPVYPSHPHAHPGMTYGVPVAVDTMAPPHQSGYAESPVLRNNMPASVASSPRVPNQSQQSPSLVLPPIRYADSEVPAQPYGMMGMGTHFSGTPWDRVNVSDARALPPQGQGMTR